MLVRFLDDRGATLGDRNMLQVPEVGDSIRLNIFEPVGDNATGEFDREFRVGKRQWTPDYKTGAFFDPLAAVVILERT